VRGPKSAAVVAPAQSLMQIFPSPREADFPVGVLFLALPVGTTVLLVRFSREVRRRKNLTPLTMNRCTPPRYFSSGAG
jgi:hypothetical protein